MTMMPVRLPFVVVGLIAVAITAKASSQEEASLVVKKPPVQVPYKILGQDVWGDDVKLPLVGAGTWQYNDTIAYQSVCKALQAGYTMIDTAFGYKNQVGVGLAIKDCWQGPRENLFVLTKLPGGLPYNETIALHYQNLWELQLDYVDHLMVHFPSDWQQQHTGKAQRQEEWRALEELYRQGKTRSIGISHYCWQHINDILEIAEIRPTLNQVEYHVGANGVDEDVQRKCAHEGILFMSFSPLCGPCQLADPDDSLITGSLVTEIASHYSNNKTGAQVALRWIVQQALERWPMAGVIPKSNNPQHIAQNIDIFDFELTQEDMDRLSSARKPRPEKGDCQVP